jgi:cell division transport system permease protein
MAQTSKSSARRSKPSYTYSIIGVAIVLFILGFVGWLFLSVKQGANAIKETVPVSAYLKPNFVNKDSIKAIQTYITSQPWSKDVKYVDKAEALKIWLKDGGEDWQQKNLLTENPLPESIDFFLKGNYVTQDSLDKISATITRLFPTQVDEVQYKKILVANLNQYVDQIGFIFLIVAIVLSIIVIISIDNTIRLAMFSNRFLIKTMQMVGATRGFIARPIDRRALLNGLISAVIAIALLFAFMQWVENIEPALKAIHNTQFTLYIFAALIIIGVTISFFSTHRSVMKYLRMKLDELY